MKTYHLGIDIGSISCKAVVCNSNREIVYSSYRYTEAKPGKKIIEVLQEIKTALDSPLFAGIVFTGSGKKIYAEKLKITPLNEIIAHAQSCWEHYPDIKSIIEIGGQDSKFIQIERKGNGAPYVENFQFNGLCSAGTGAFLDQQSERLGLSIEEFGDKAYNAKTVPVIAGRCSVFAKSDMIHLQQKGTDAGAISAGLCYALARNYLATLCKGKVPEQPIAFQGGVASNRGMLRAFSAVFHIPESDIIIPSYHKLAGAYGAALHSIDYPLSKVIPITELLETAVHMKNGDISNDRKKYAPLKTEEEAENRNKSDALSTEISAPVQEGETLFLGLDIGSVTTKAVLLNKHGKITARAAEPTRSEPIQSSSLVLKQLENTVAEKHVTIGGFYTTGSGRHLVKEVFGADEAVDEITSHSRSAAFFVPEADTIFEIGGQDSKFIRLEQGAVKNFSMNRLCAAGTGSFLEEQAGRLSIDIRDDFSEYAFTSSSPVSLGTRCTVFMDSDLVHHIQRGESTENLCAGLAFSIVENYLENVTHSGDLGKQIIFQGGVANNKGVRAAFESFLDRKIHLHPAPTYAGAVGAALIAQEEMQNNPSIFPGFTTAHLDYSVQYKTCEDCPNQCEIMTVQSGPDTTISFGSICGKHDTLVKKSDRTEKNKQAGSPFETYRRLLYTDYVQKISTKPQGDRASIALPSGLTLYEDLPFWSTFFKVLGYTVQYTGDSSLETAEQGKEQLPVETCMPVRMLYGHALSPAASEADFIFVPHSPCSKPDGEEKERYLCPYTQTIGYIIRKKIHSNTIILGKPQEEGLQEWIHRSAHELHIPKREVARALNAAKEAELLFQKECKEEGKRLLKRIEEEGSLGLVMIGRPYIAYDRYLTMDAAEKIQDFGMVPVPIDFLEIENEPLGAFWDEVHWQMGRKLLKAAAYTRRSPYLFPVLLTSFGCGPDGFIIPFLEDILMDSPRLILEFDENRIDTGLITRIEAYTRSLKNKTTKTAALNRSQQQKHILWRPEKPLKEYDCYIPYFSDHAYAYAGSLNAAGCRAAVLPPTDEHSLELARAYASGNECHPFLTILGDLLRLAESKNGSTAAAAGQNAGLRRDAIYYSPKYVGSCLINAYETSMQLALDKMEVDNVRLLDFGNMELMKELGLIYPYYLAMSSYSIDRLTKWAFEIAPYEEVPGTVMKVHKSNMELLMRRMAEQKIMKGIRESTDRMKEVRLGKKPRRPAIGIAGDVFTRINPAANFGLFDKLQRNGFDTMASALIMDVVLYRYEQLQQIFKDDGKPLLHIGAKAMLPAISVLKGRVDRFFPDNLRTPQESQFPKVYERTKDFIDYRVDNLISLNLNRIYELNHAGAKGILNVMCPNCMVGTMSEAFFPELKEEQPELPITSLSFGDQQETHIDNRLEAFMHLVKEMQKKSDKL